ncbi:hypothetical protein DAEQUDRAFT_769650 [Daedalea quercina L-15889]|uniref:Metallo-beta-lactamase domain-containing protein n=1 Tax=Daedalea quercina L-15889 TaxID=1314783 RepID=A0A165LK92_9APHY|nr:hypothetical protein DAEQUDRAFT_769650 [Daedalea quercina L-15889]
MSHDITVTFLGTASGGGPTETRNCSSLVVDALGDQSLWTDHTAGILTLLRNTLGIPKIEERSHAGRATEPPSAPTTSIVEDPPVASSSVTKLTESSHNTEKPHHTRTDSPRIEIFGPRGLRRFLRLQMLLTHTRSQERYAVHELLAANESPSCPSDIPAKSERDTNEEGRLLDNEAPGKDIRCDSQGYWREIVVSYTGFVQQRSSGQKGTGRIIVDAGPIDHRDPCIGFVIREIPHLPEPAALQSPIPVPRKLVILGDTVNSDALIPLIDPPSSGDTAGGAAQPVEVDMDVDQDVPPGDASVGIEDAIVMPDVQKLIAKAPVSLLIHEATDAYISPVVDPQEKTGRNRTHDLVDEKTRARGHSTPRMAGEFAHKIGAERLVLNHIGARFPAPEKAPRTAWGKFQLACVREIEKQARATWKPPKTQPPTYVTAAYDYYRITIPPNRPPPSAEDDSKAEREEKGVSDHDQHHAQERYRAEEGHSRREESSHAWRQAEQRDQSSALRGMTCPHSSVMK